MTMRRVLAVVGVGCCVVLLWGCSRPAPPPPAGPPAQDAAGAAPAAPAPADAAPPVLRYLAAETSGPGASAVVVGGHALVFTRQLLPVDTQGNVVGADSAEAQCKQVLDDLGEVLKSVGSSLQKLVRVHVCADSAETLQAFDQALAERLPSEVRPAITRVVSPLPVAGAKLGVDAVTIAAAAPAAPSVRLIDCPAVAGSPDAADAAVVPWAGMVWFSGQAEKGTPAEAAARALDALWKMMDELDLKPSQVVQLKVFVDSMSAVDEVRQAIARRFPGQSAPPVVFVQWIASAPVEIEMAAFLPGGSVPSVPSAPSPSSAGSASSAHSAPSTAPLRYYNPPHARPSPNFSRVAITRADSLVFIPGLVSRQPGDGTAQVRDVFAQLEEILDATGSDLKHLAKATYYVSDADASSALDKLRREYYDPERPPAASKAMVPGLGQADRGVAIDMIAVPATSRP